MKYLFSIHYKKVAILICLFCLLAAQSCGSRNTAVTEQNEEEHHDGHENESTVTLTDEQAKSIKIELGNIEKKELTSSIKANGILRVPNQNRATVTTLAGGIVKSILVQTGNTVRKGQPVAIISNTTFISMQEEYLAVASKVNFAELETRRQQDLQQGNAGALKTLQQAEMELKTLSAKKASLQKQLELIGIETASLSPEDIQSAISINSPINGSVSEVMVNIGSYLDANTVVAQIIDNSQLHLDLYVYERDLAKVKVGQTIHFTLTNNPGKEYDADVYAISNTFENNTKAIAVHANVKGDKQGLIDGMNITALVSLENATVDAVPADAIVNHEGQDYIFIVTDAHSEVEHHTGGQSEHQQDEHGHEHAEAEVKTVDEGITFERIPVRKGTTDIGYSEITLLKDIPIGAKIVTNGAFFVLAKMTNQGEAHEH
jgi:cobalt-zinc-cadmium efflux system membrane fusion protein